MAKRESRMLKKCIKLAGIALLFRVDVNCAPIDNELFTVRAEPVPASYFAQNILFHPLNHVPWPSVPFGGWRTSHVNWADLQPERNRWDFSLLDKYVDWSVAHHTPILMPLTYTPRWASSTPDAFTDVEAGNPLGLSGSPRDMEDWRFFVRTVATRYKGRIRDWEIWNEPNRPQSWTGSVDTLVAMTHEAARMLKKIDPGCRVVSPAPTGVNGLPFFESFLKKGGGQDVDVIGYHFYVGHADPPEAVPALISQVRAAMERNGVASKPLWNTEAGWLGPYPLAEDLQAAYLSRAYLLNWAAGVSRFYWYAWESHLGTQIELVKKDNATLTPAGGSFVTVQTWMTGAVVLGCRSSGEVWICELRRNGQTSHVVWSTGGNLTWVFPEDWRPNVITGLSGAHTLIAGKSIPVGPQPELIEERRITD